MEGEPLTPHNQQLIVSSTLRRVAELEDLCEDPSLLNGKFDQIRAVKKVLRVFAGTLPFKPVEALLYWRTDVEPAFAIAFAAIVEAIADLMTRYGQLTVVRARDRARPSRSNREGPLSASP
jgi:hypothetical protein